ncbi:EamA family transporter [Ferroplasma sp.]|uniref:EamA family transporter n=1 Tax=Ferroplasma sp. TaxID=2591003 RepID=UPI00307D4EFE
MLDLLLIPAFTLLFWTVSNSLIKGLTAKISTNEISIIITGAGVIPMVISIFIMPAESISIMVMSLSLVSGVLLGLGYILFYRSLKSENLGNAGVTINIQQIVVISFGLLILKETVTSFILPGIILIILGSIFVTVKKGFKVNKVLLIAALANIIWGIYYIPLSFAILSLHASPVPLLMARITGFLSVLLIFNFPAIIKKARSVSANVNNNHPKVAYSVIFLAILAGLLDGSGNVFYSLSIQDGILILAGSLIAMLPASLAISGKFLYHEKLNIAQYSGILLSVTGALIIALA